MENGFEKDFAVVWPTPSIGDMQGGIFRTRMPANNLNHFTATTGPAIFRGDALPADMKGHLLFAEPVGRLIRRAAVENIEGLTQLRNVYPQSEFVNSVDQLFRPVNISNAPDGTLYIADMYHGIIQERQWSGPGSTCARRSSNTAGQGGQHGRIWRLRYDGRAAVPGRPQRMGSRRFRRSPRSSRRRGCTGETPAQLVAHLAHPNGWWRDMAQRLLILKQDKSVVPALQQMARSSDNLLARFHALWTLEGLGALDAALVREAMKDANPRLRIQAMRVERDAVQGRRQVVRRRLPRHGEGPGHERRHPGDAVGELLQAEGPARHRQGDAGIEPREGGRADRCATACSPRRRSAAAADVAAAAHAGRNEAAGAGPRRVRCRLLRVSRGRRSRRPASGAPAGTMMAPPLAGSPRVQGHRDYIIKILLKGMTGELDGKTYRDVMVPMDNTNEWIAGIAWYVRTSFGNTGDLVTPADVARVRAEIAGRKGPWTIADLEASLPAALDWQQWKLTASHGAATAPAAATLRGWTSGARRCPACGSRWRCRSRRW